MITLRGTETVAAERKFALQTTLSNYTWHSYSSDLTKDDP